MDYDTDGSGLYRAKNSLNFDASVILDTSQTRVNAPVDLTEAVEVEERLPRRRSSRR